MNLPAIAFGSLFILVGLVISAFLARSLLAALRSKSWPSVEGLLDQAAFKRIEVVDGPGNTGHAMTRVDFVYSYTVDGVDHRGTRVTFSDSIVKTGGSLRKLKERVKEGGAVPVYYDPANPSDSALIPGPSVYNYTPFITPLLMIGIGVAIAAFNQQLLEMIK